MRLVTTFVSLLLFFTVAIQGQRRTQYIAKIKHTPPLSIPEEARKSGVGGEMYIRVNLDTDGNVINVESVAGPSPICQNVMRPDLVALRQAAADAAKFAKFEPVIEDGKRQLASGFVRFDVPTGNPERPESEGQVRELGSLAEAGADGSESFLKRSALNLPKPVYPPAARVLRASGPVSVKMLIDESGSVFSAQAVTGHPLLRAAAAQAACQAKFRPTILTGKSVKVTGIITYNFVP